MSFGTLAFALIVLQYAGFSEPRSVKLKNSGNDIVHHRMNLAELERYFGASTVDEVSDYEISHPFLSNETGDFISNDVSNHHSRHTRRTGQTDLTFYNVSAFGKTWNLKLSVNKHLLAQNFAVEGRNTKRASRKNVDHLIGSVIGHPESTAAITNGDGLEGMIKLKDDVFFIHLLPAHLAANYRRSPSSVPHIVVKKSVAKREKCNSDGQIGQPHDRVRRSTVPDKYLKTHYVVDEVCANFHTEETMEYILPVLANMVTGLFRDDSFGEIKLNYILTKITFLNSSVLTYSESASLSTKYSAIRAWANENNPQPESNPDHWDDVTLITRGSAVSGYAGINTICKGEQTAVNVVAMNGINCVATVAHEVFHNFGGTHDGTTEDCPSGSYVMSISSANTGLAWSECSRIYAQSFLGSTASSCLDDAPSQVIERPIMSLAFSRNLMGVSFDADEQCKLMFGDLWRKCPINQHQCTDLYCTKDDASCATLYVPPLEGTRCGPRNWCIKEECIDDGSIVVHGGWGEWSAYGPCTRTCGGGVQSRQRNCDNPSPANGGNDCVGDTPVEFSTCNTQACPEGSVSFRQQQCSEKGDYDEYIDSGDRCRLWCRNGNSLTRFSEHCKDGTRCYNSKYVLDVCVGGQCKQVGCDHNLDSEKRLDRCGICGGDGSSCKLQTFNYTKTGGWDRSGLSKITNMTIIAAHSANIVAVLKAAAYNQIGVQTNEEYLCSAAGGSRICDAAGSNITYVHESSFFKDELHIPGPITQDIQLVFIYRYERSINECSVDISYYAPLIGPSEITDVTFEWHVSDWSGCSRSCAGTKSRLVKCVRSDDKTNADNTSCDESTKPLSEESCNTNACIPEWFVTDWEECSLLCGNGSQQRSVICRKEVIANVWNTLESINCTEPQPEVSLFRHCNAIDCPPEYVVTEWSECSTSCDPGTRTRVANCQRRLSLGVSEIVPDFWCENYHIVKPSTTMTCNTNFLCEHVVPSLTSLGCYNDDKNDRACPTMFKSFRHVIDWYDMDKTIMQCAWAAKHLGYKIYGIQFYGECWGCANDLSYERHGASSNCFAGVGGDGANFVYKITN